jgi:hypothetical protein
MATGTVTSLDHDSANYERLSWTDKGEGLTVLKGKEDRALTDKRYGVLGFTGLRQGGEPKKIEYDPSKDESFPEGMTISGNRAPQWTEGWTPSCSASTSRASATRPPGRRAAHRRPRGPTPRRRPRRARRTPRTMPTRRWTSSSGTGRTRGSSRSSRSRNRRPQLQLPGPVPRRFARSSSGLRTTSCGR